MIPLLPVDDPFVSSDVFAPPPGYAPGSADHHCKKVAAHRIKYTAQAV